MSPSTKRKASSSYLQPLPTKRPTPSSSNHRTLVCAVRGLPGRVCAITVSADASIHHLKELIHQQNAPHLSDVSPSTLDAYYTWGPRLGWARVGENGAMVGRGDPRSKSFLVPTRRVRDYFPSNIPKRDSGVVHVVVDFIVRNSVTSQVNEIGTMPLEDDKPLPGEDDDDDEEGCERASRVQDALGLLVGWSIPCTDFSQPHDYQGAKWLEYGFGFDHPSRVYIGDKITWRELYVACDEVVQKHEGNVGFRCVEGFSRVNGGPTLRLIFGT
ncbi:hypothetical protein PF003_g19797 [Phytophthora fragariae]|nr:hypothetical protein PF003_g19797 [Phytophthora fragariae]